MRAFFAKKVHMPWYWTLACLCGAAGLILCFGTALQYGSVVATLGNYLRHPALLLLNLFPIVVVLTVAYGLCGNAFYAASATSLLFHLLSLVNLIKIECRNDPLVPDDIFLLREAMQATGEYRLNLHIPYIIAIVLLAAALAVAGIKLKSARPKALWRAVIAVLPIGAFVLSMATVYPNVTLYNDLVHSIDYIYEYNIPEVFDALGFNYCFLRNFRLYKVEKPNGYSESEAAAWAEGGTSGSSEGMPNVIFIQCEAFSDLFANDVFTYAAQDNPQYAYDLVANSERALSGHIVVTNYGAGTANTEFDVITGMQSHLLASVPTSAFRVIHRNTNSLARVFAADGYQTYFMHPGHRWFYNRESVYNYFGIRDTVFSDAFSDADYKGNMISETAFLRQLTEDFAARTAASDAPLFAFTVTIQNHQSYPYSKYYGMEVAPAQLSVPVSDGAMEELSVYAEGIRDSAQMLYALTEYLDAADEPTLVVFWGDHLPALGSNFSVYRELGLEIGETSTPDVTLQTYTTPFVIWANAAYCEENDFAQAAAALDLPDDPLISDIYLGELVYELLGMTGQDAYFDYLAEARRALPVFHLGAYLLPDGVYTDTLPEEAQAIVEKLHKWQYYRLTDEPVR